nr:type II toxin-antitoxin system RelE/ParE family toxin [Clostridia bacterium]
MIYKIKFSPQSSNDIDEIYNYILFDSQSIETANEQHRRILESIKSLTEFPHRFRIYDKQPWNKLGMRMMVSGNYNILYIPDEEKLLVNIVRVLHSRRNLDRILKETEY